MGAGKIARLAEVTHSSDQAWRLGHSAGSPTTYNTVRPIHSHGVELAGVYRRRDDVYKLVESRLQ